MLEAHEVAQKVEEGFGRNSGHRQDHLARSLLNHVLWAAGPKARFRVRCRAAHIFQLNVTGEKTPYPQLWLLTMLMVELSLVNDIVVREAKLIQHLRHLLPVQLLVHQIFDLLGIVDMLQGKVRNETRQHH